MTTVMGQCVGRIEVVAAVVLAAGGFRNARAESSEREFDLTGCARGAIVVVIGGDMAHLGVRLVTRRIASNVRNGVATAVSGAAADLSGRAVFGAVA